MQIDINQQSIILSDVPSLKLHQLSNLSFWGFVKDPLDDFYLATPPELESLLKTVVDFLNKETIDYILSPECQIILDKIQKKTVNFQNLRTMAKRYKEGHFDTKLFSIFADTMEEMLNRKLKQHQLKSAYHLYLVKNGANFSVPGSGKTMVVLAVYEKLKQEKKVDALFVVGPPACFSPWQEEFAVNLGRDASSVILVGDIKNRKQKYDSAVMDDSELYLTTFQTLSNDQDEVISFLNQKRKIFFVVDEAHYMKQLDGVWASALLNVCRNASFRCILTGTPVPRSYTDIFNLFDFLWPDTNPLDSETKVKIKVLEESAQNEMVKRILEKKIGPLFYRVRKSDLNLQRPIFHGPIKISMNEYERVLYEAIETKIRRYSDEDYLKNIEFIEKLRKGRITRLRQATSYAKLLITAVEGYHEDLLDGETDLISIIQNYDQLEVPAKIQHLLGLVQKFKEESQKVVIWSNFVGTLKLIVKHIKKLGIKCKLIYGGVPFEKSSIKEEETREKIRDEFTDPDSGLDVLVANPAACAESISLHKTCQNAIYYDLSYNCAQYLQSLDRIHRVGGSESKTSHYYFLQYENSVDQDIKENLDRKSQKMYDLIDEDYSIYSLDMFGVDDDLQGYERLFLS